MRQTLYRVLLKGRKGTANTITIAAFEVEKIPAMVESFKPMYMANMQDEIIGFEITSNTPTITMSDEQYTNEVMFCDIVQEQAQPVLRRPEGATTYYIGSKKANEL